MADFRKHEEKVEGLAAAVRAAIGGDVRPNQPGAQQPPAAEPSPKSSNTAAFLTFRDGKLVGAAEELDD